MELTKEQLDLIPTMSGLSFPEGARLVAYWAGYHIQEWDDCEGRSGKMVSRRVYSLLDGSLAKDFTWNENVTAYDPEALGDVEHKIRAGEMKRLEALLDPDHEALFKKGWALVERQEKDWREQRAYEERLQRDALPGKGKVVLLTKGEHAGLLGKCFWTRDTAVGVNYYGGRGYNRTSTVTKIGLDPGGERNQKGWALNPVWSYEHNGIAIPQDVVDSIGPEDLGRSPLAVALRYALGEDTDAGAAGFQKLLSLLGDEVTVEDLRTQGQLLLDCLEDLEEVKKTSAKDLPTKPGTNKRWTKKDLTQQLEETKEGVVKTIRALANR